MTRVTAWVGAGVFTAGMSAAMLAGAGTANADEDGASTHETKPAATQNDTAKRPQHRNAYSAKQRPTAKVSDDTTARREAKRRTAPAEESSRPAGQLADAAVTKARKEFRDSTREVRKALHNIGGTSRDGAADTSRDGAAGTSRDGAADANPVRAAETTSVVEDATHSLTGKAPSAVEVRVRPPLEIRTAAPVERVSSPAWRSKSAEELRDNHIEAIRDVTEPAVPSQADAARPETLASTSTATSTSAATTTRPDPVEAFHDVLRSLGALVLNPEPQHYPKPLSAIGDVVFDTLATLERAVGGDPVVPPELRNSVQVSTSTLVVSKGHEVESNWYFPDTKEGQPAPTRMIYLQHGFLANGPVYSYTASYLAHTTNSIVVTTTFTSNPFEADGMWLGGDNLHEAVAQLFLDPNRTALNASMDTAELKAGRTENIEVPTQFVLVGHSLGGGFAPGVAGYYAEGLTRRRDQGLDAPNDLAGVVTYDAVPMGSIIPDAMGRLNVLETNGTTDPSDDDPNDYIPIYEIGAPLNFLNVFSDVNDQLSEARPGQFTGVVLKDGVHMDPMQGGNPLIQVVAYLIAGFPQPQNPLAVRDLSAGWINDMFEDNIDPATGACKTGVTCAGHYGDGDDSFTITTAKGDAVAVMIGSKRAADLTSLHAISVSDFISAIPAGVLNGVLTTCDLFTEGKCTV